MITIVYSVDKTDDIVEVTAVIEDTKLVYAGSIIDPPEYGPGICKTKFYLDEEEVLPEDEDELISFLESMDLDWELVGDDNS
jgi:hypothetical protein